MQQTKAAAGALDARLRPLATRHFNDLQPAFAEAAREKADALIVFTHGFAGGPGHPMRAEMDRRAFMSMVGGSILAAPIAAETQQAAMKASRLRDYVAGGGLLSYGSD